MVRNLTAKLVYRPTGVSELYDLAADPRETANLFGAPAAAALRGEMLSKLLDFHVLTSDVTPDEADSRGAPAYPHPLAPGDPWASRLDVGARAHSPPVTDPLALNGVDI